MNESPNIQMQAEVYAQGAELVARGLAMIFGTVADSLSGVTNGMKFNPTSSAEALENSTELKPHPDRITSSDIPLKLGPEVDQAEAQAEAQVEPKAKAALMSETPAEAPVNPPSAPPTNPPAKRITKDDVQRAMAVKVKQLAAKGKEVTLIGTLFPQFHGAQCVSDLTEADYPVFLDELAKL